MIEAKSQDVANFTFTTGPNRTVSFTNTSVLTGTADRKAFWSFGDGSQQLTAVLANAAHQYNNDGIYNVCLKIYKYFNNHDSIATADVCKKIELSALQADSCTASFEYKPTTNVDLRELFIAHYWHNNQKKPDQICWNFGDDHDTCINYNSQASANYAIYHTYTRGGTYTVCITIKYQGGCTSHYCHEIKFIETSTCKTEYRTETVNDLPLSRYFIAQPWHSLQKRPVRICWNFGDGKDSCIQYNSSLAQNYAIKHSYSHPGKYQVCVNILFDGGCEAHYCNVENIITPTPTDSCFINIYEAATSLNNSERKFYIGLQQHRPVQKLCWSFGDGKDSCINITNPPTDRQLMITHVYPAPGRYHACVKVWYDGGCTAQKCLLVEIAKPNTNICGGYMTDSLLSGTSIFFKGFGINNPNDHVISWRWAFGDGSVGDGKEIKHEFAKGGTYTVCLFIKTDFGCETKICKTITVSSTNVEVQLQLSPNPVINTLHTIFRSGLQEDVTIRIYSASGVLLKTYTRNAIAGVNTWTFDVSSLPAGLYSVIIQSSHQLATAIFFKQ